MASTFSSFGASDLRNMLYTFLILAVATSGSTSASICESELCITHILQITFRLADHKKDDDGGHARYVRIPNSPL